MTGSLQPVRLSAGGMSDGVSSGGDLRGDLRKKSNSCDFPGMDPFPVPWEGMDKQHTPQIRQSQQTQTSQVSTLRSRFKYVPLSVVFLALVTPLVFDKVTASKPPTVPTPNGVDWSGASETVRKELKGAAGDAAKAESKVQQDYEHQLESVRETNRKEIASGVESAVGHLVQVGEIGWLISDFAQDKVLGGTRATDRIKGASKDYTVSFENSAIRMAGLVDRTYQELESVNNRYAISVGEIVTRGSSSLPHGRSERLEELRKSIPRKIVIDVGATTVALAFEAIYVQATKKSLQGVVGWLATKLEPQIAKAAVGVGAAVVDGPLPIGDIVTVGLAIWTAYDVVSLPGEIRGNVQEAFQSEGDQHLSNLEKQANAAVKKFAESSQKSRASIHEHLVIHLQ